MKLSDLIEPNNLSGFKYVVRAGNGNGWQASRNGGGRRDGWRGPLRRTAKQAALDYLAYVNNGSVVPAGRKKSAGKRVPRDPINDHEVEAALGVLRDARAQRRKLAQGYVYLISDGTAVKVGYSVKPEARVAELQTGNPRALVLLAKKAGTEATEADVHAKFMDDNLILEWFRPSTPLLSWFGVRWDADKRLAWMKNARRKP